ncbi:hypothetical protein [Paenibacillus glycanilyticus]|uniref:hypothetical protein n=1 Tax=Paenibacillus glycanilyticus TaxID=126569 RepID=UPI000FDA120B|nr:hypothetical protein [Paenibacillus glycanilyticus]
MALYNLLGTSGNFNVQGGTYNGSGVYALGWNGLSGLRNTSMPTLENVGGDNYAQRITGTAADTNNQRFMQRPQPTTLLFAGKYYIYLVDVVTDGISPANILIINGAGNAELAKTTSSPDNKTHYIKYTPAQDEAAQMRITNWGALGTSCWAQFDNARVYEIDQATYNKIDVDPAYSGANLAAMFPYTEPPVIGPLNNLLGTRGNFETIIGLATGASAAIALDSTTKTQGNNSLKLSIATSSNSANAFWGGIFNVFDKTKYYIMLVDVKCGTGSAGWAYFDYYNGSGYPSKTGNKITSTTGYGTSYLKLSPTELSVAQSAACHCFMSGTTGQYVNFDGMRLYEISKDVYDLIDAHPDYTGENLAALFPYRNGSGYVPAPKTWTSSDKLNAADMNAIEQNAANLANYLNSLSYTIPALSFTTNRTTTTVETFASLNRFEAALVSIRDGLGTTPEGFRPRRTWDSTQRISFDDPNRWQTDIQALFDAAASVEKGFIYCGTISAGQTWAIRAG